MKKIQKTICREELKSRIPGLFAYIEENDADEFKLHKATDSLQGCWGKIIENIKLPNGINLKIGNETILSQYDTNKKEPVYSYRTLISYYYQYKDYPFKTSVDDGSFIGFMEEGIGKIEINFTTLGLNEKDNDLVPHYIYLANVRNLINQYSKLKVIYDYYKDEENVESDICCLLAKYIRMGGDIMYNELIRLNDIAETEATKYYGYAVKDADEVNNKVTKKLTLNMGINLNQSIHDIGYLSCYLNDWVGGDAHKEGELYTYDGNTYVCMKDNNDEFNKETFEFDFKEDSRHFQKLTDISRWPKPLQPGNKTIRDNIIKADNPYGTKFVVERDEYELDYSADSKLKSLRRYKTYINGEDIEEEPSDNEDWLFYYRIGVVSNYTTVTDEFGNICDIEELNKGNKVAAETGDKLAAFGNVITNIVANKNKRTITFTYVINAHLKSSELQPEKINGNYPTDDDGNKLYKFKDFVYDDSTAYKHYGVKYEETYTYDEGSELDTLVKGQDAFTFYEYVNDINDTITSYNKYAFSLVNSTRYYDKRLDTQIVSIPYVKSDYEAIIKNETDYLFADTFKRDYLNDITYKPTVENDVRIDRGNYAAFEKHLKLGEIKSMETMENFSNGSFFNIQKVN